MNGLFEWLRGLLGGGSPARRVADALATRMGTTVQVSGHTLRLGGSWQSQRLQLVLDGVGDSLRATLRCPAPGVTWEVRRVDGAATGSSDGRVLEALPLSVRLHVIEVVESGRTTIRLSGGSLVLDVPSAAGLSRDNAADQAAIRLDVLADLAKALPQALAVANAGGPGALGQGDRD